MSVKLRTPYVLTLLEVASPPVAEAGLIKLYALDAGGGNVELFIRGADGSESQVTDGGAITAGALLNATGNVDVSVSAAPIVGQALVATSPTTAIWQNASTLQLTSTAPVAVDAGLALLGDSTEAAKGNHKHSVLTGTPSALVVGGSNAPGNLDSLARADHLHGLPGFGATAGTFAQGNDARFTDDRTASGLRTTTGIVSISSAVAPSAGLVLTATGPTGANWQTPPSGGGGGEGSPVSEFATAPASPHPNDREFTSPPSGWGLYDIGLRIGTQTGVLVTPTAGNPNFGAGLTTSQTRLVVNPEQKRSWGVWDSFAEDKAWFYGFPLTLATSNVFRARLSMMNDVSGSIGSDWGNQLQLVLVVSSGGLPDFSGVCIRMGWLAESGTIKIKSGHAVSGNPAYRGQSLDLSDLTVPDCEFVIRLFNNNAYFFTRTSGQTLAYGSLPSIAGAGFGPGAAIWAGFVWNSVNAITPGSKMYAADYFRQQDDATFYG